jgi:hypothetical protein
VRSPEIKAIKIDNRTQPKRIVRAPSSFCILDKSGVASMNAPPFQTARIPFMNDFGPQLSFTLSKASKDAWIAEICNRVSRDSTTSRP